MFVTSDKNLQTASNGFSEGFHGFRWASQELLFSQGLQGALIRLFGLWVSESLGFMCVPLLLLLVFVEGFQDSCRFVRFYVFLLSEAAALERKRLRVSSFAKS